MVKRVSDALRSDAAMALLLAIVLAAVGCWRDWATLSALHLPDTDDVMRLQQIRDWLAGQSFADLAQHRLGDPPGLPMHWSRLADLVPGAIIALLAPITGRHAAELAAVIAWPTILCAAALWLIAAIARRLEIEAARTAPIIAAIAYPATTLFIPGRIDHHGLQIVMLLAIVHALIAPLTARRGTVIALAACASLVIGLETAPFLAVAGLVLWVRWVRREDGATPAMTMFGVGLAGSLAAAAIVFHTHAWRYPACDGFDGDAWRAAEIAALAAAGLGLAGRRMKQPYGRLAASLIAGIGASAAVLSVSPDCLDPYGHVDPLLARLWLANVGEAQPLFAAAPAVAIGYVGLMAAGILAGFWQGWRSRDARWAILLAFQLAALTLSVFELRGAYAGAMLAAVPLAAAIAVARRQGSLALVGVWLVSAGILYPLTAEAIAGHSPSPAQPVAGNDAGDCTSPDTVAAIAALPPGRVMGPVDLGAYLLAGSSDSVVAAPYHRNNSGNAAMYRFFLGSPDEAEAIARKWHVRYVVLCADSFSELGSATIDDPRRMIGRLRAGKTPLWMTRSTSAGSPTIFIVANSPRMAGS